MIQPPSTPQHKLTRECNTMPFPEFKFGFNSKFQFPIQNKTTESPCKSHSEVFRNQTLPLQIDVPSVEEIYLEDDLTFSSHISIPLIRAQEDDEYEENGCTLNDDSEENSESCEDDSITSSILSSRSDFESSTPSSSPILGTDFLKPAIPDEIFKNTTAFNADSLFKSPASNKMRFKPNRSLKPKKAILKRTNGLNYIMNSLNGNFKDATIFATEVNSYLSENVPYPTCPLERVTIPVNSEIKRKYKEERNELLGGYYNSSDDECDQNSPSFLQEEATESSSNTNKTKIGSDAAVIRAYEFTFGSPTSSTSSEKDSDRLTLKLGIDPSNQVMNVKKDSGKEKRLRWCDSIEW